MNNKKGGAFALFFWITMGIIIGVVLSKIFLGC